MQDKDNTSIDPADTCHASNTYSATGTTEPVDDVTVGEDLDTEEDISKV